MARYNVILATTVSYPVEVEADSPEAAEEEALNEGLPGLMFLDHRYPDVGDWEPVGTPEELS